MHGCHLLLVVAVHCSSVFSAVSTNLSCIHIRPIEYYPTHWQPPATYQKCENASNVCVQTITLPRKNSTSKRPPRLLFEAGCKSVKCNVHHSCKRISTMEPEWLEEQPIYQYQCCCTTGICQTPAMKAFFESTPAELEFLHKTELQKLPERQVRSRLFVDLAISIGYLFCACIVQAIALRYYRRASSARAGAAVPPAPKHQPPASWSASVQPTVPSVRTTSRDLLLTTSTGTGSTGQ